MTEPSLQKQPPRFSRLRRRKRGRGFQSHSLATRLIVIILLVLLLSHVLALLIAADDRRQALRGAAREAAAQRIIAVVNLLEASGPSLHREILAAASSPGLHFRLTPAPFVKAEEIDSRIEGFMRDKLVEALERPDGHILLAFQPEWSYDRAWFEPERWRPFPTPPWKRRWHDGDWDEHDGDDDDRDEDEEEDHDPPPKRLLDKPRIGLLASIRLNDGTWLNSASALRRPDHAWGAPALVSFGLSAIAVIIVVTWLVRRTMRPLRALTEAATRFGQGERPEPVPEDGPADIRQLIAAFNTMRDRIDRFVGERMQMLAALSHDLRTPITTLRLRAELLEDEEQRDRFVAALEELQAMTDEVLAFVRSEAASEETVPLDVAALLEGLAREYREAGADVAVTIAEAPEKAAVRCRPLALKRALRNLIGNAVRHGEHVRIETRLAGGAMEIVICDDGPGIAQEDLERAFEPFVRLDPARGADTGGVGLGLSIARSVAHAHGGDISLENRPEGGLCAIFSLPAQS